MSPKLFGFLSDFQMSFTTVIHGTGILPHHHQTELTKSNKGFYDGNLIESFLKLPVSDMESVIKGLKVIKKYLLLYSYLTHNRSRRKFLPSN